MLYFSVNAELNAVRTGDFKVSFATLEGNITDAVRFQSNWPQVVHLRADSFEKAPHESGMYLRWMADNMWLFVPVGGQVQEFMATLGDYPMQESQVLNPGNFNQNTYMLQGKLKQLEQIRQKVLK